MARELFGASERFIGITIVAFGTSAPELLVCLKSALTDKASLAIGNAVGSNIFNLGFILGGCAAIRPIVTSRALVYRDLGHSSAAAEDLRRYLAATDDAREVARMQGLLEELERAPTRLH